MKKTALLLALLVLVVSLCACGGKTEEVTETTTEVETTNDNVSINIKKELIQDVESYKAENSKYEGVTITETEDLIILNMNAASYDKFVEIKHTEAINAYDALLKQEGTFVEKFDYDLNFRSVKVYVNREKYDAVSHNSTEYITYAANALAYQMYLPNGQQCTVQVIYSDTQEVIGTTTLPNQIELK